MLKKITFISVLVLVFCLIAGVVLTPLAVREFLQNGDQIIGNFVRSTEIYSFDAKNITHLELSFNDLTIYIEQSKDNNVYLRMEGLFADRYSVSDRQRQAEEKSILSLSVDNDSLFFDTSVPYLLRSGLVDTSAAWVIVRIPSWVSVETLGSPWNIRYTESVQFQNRAYYEERLWNARDEDWEREQSRREQVTFYLDRFNAMKGAFTSELRKDLVQLETGEISLDSYSSRLDEAASEHLERMQQQLFTDFSELFDLDTLTTLLENYFELYCSAMKQQGLMEKSEEFSDEYHLLQERYFDLKNAADTALEEFLDYYEGYLSDLSENNGQAPDPALETAEEAKETGGDAFASSAPAEIEIVSSSISSPQEDVLSAPSVHTEP